MARASIEIRVILDPQLVADLGLPPFYQTHGLNVSLTDLHNPLIGDALHQHLETALAWTRQTLEHSQQDSPARITKEESHRG